MDTYGHLFPGQEAEAAIGMAKLLAQQTTESNSALATGTDDMIVPFPTQSETKSLSVDLPQEQSAAHAQRAAREMEQSGATACELPKSSAAQTNSRNSLPVAALCDVALPETQHGKRIFSAHMPKSEVCPSERGQPNHLKSSACR